MNLDIEKALFDIPEGVEFPMELCHHLRTKLNSVIEQNCQLKRHIIYLDKEVIELRKSKLEQFQHQKNELKLAANNGTVDTMPPQSLMASKIVELSKKNRDMTAQLEGAKTKLKKIMSENEQLLQFQSDKEFEDKDKSEAVDEDAVSVMSSPSQVTHLTNKMMEYRRKCHQLQIELKTATRALAQEVGDSATPQSVLNSVSQCSWRGRQQQIISLQQKVTDLQAKLMNKPENFCGDGPCFLGDGDASMCSEASSNIPKKYGSVTSLSISSNYAPSNRTGLMQQDMKKQEQIRKLNGEIAQLSQDLKNRQQDLKASKARIQTLEAQGKSYRNQIDLTDAKFQEKELETKTIWDEMNQLKQELISVKDREKRNRDKTSLEVQEATRSLTRERAIVGRLQQVINEKQEAIQKADSEIIELQNKLELCCSSKVAGGMNAIERLQELELQLRQYSHLLASSDKEQKRLIELVDKGVAESERDRNKLIKAQRESSQIYVVLQQANKCIDQCLDAANVTDSTILQEVENIRTMIRELQTGELYSLNSESSTSGTSSVKKLKTRIDLLNKEIVLLKHNLQELTIVHKNEMSNYAKVYETLKQELILDNINITSKGKPKQ
ncbi:coiled-coil domain-containing protein 13 isoform X1 [Folsomia candida]|nr:coiled-coil domain-containing protein 13 isoform X1 [Folsomia candida]